MGFGNARRWNKGWCVEKRKVTEVVAWWKWTKLWRRGSVNSRALYFEGMQTSLLSVTAPAEAVILIFETCPNKVIDWLCHCVIYQYCCSSFSIPSDCSSWFINDYQGWLSDLRTFVFSPSHHAFHPLCLAPCQTPVPPAPLILNLSVSHSLLLPRPLAFPLYLRVSVPPSATTCSS